MFKSVFGDFAPDIFKFTEEWSKVRLVGSMFSVFEFWIPILTENDKPLSIRKICLDWNGEKHSMITDRCPYRIAGLKGRPVYYSNAIVRSLQRRTKRPAKSSKCASPVRVLQIPPRLHQSLQTVSALNHRITKSGTRRSYDLAHLKFGRDVQIKINPESPYSYYDLEPLEHTRLTASEMAYPLFPLMIEPETRKEAEVEWKKLKRVYEDR